MGGLDVPPAKLNALQELGLTVEQAILLGIDVAPTCAGSAGAVEEAVQSRKRTRTQKDEAGDELEVEAAEEDIEIGRAISAQASLWGVVVQPRRRSSPTC